MPIEWPTRRPDRYDSSERPELERTALRRQVGALAAEASSRVSRQLRLSRWAALLLVLVYIVLRLRPLGSAFDQSLRGDPFGSGFWFTAASDLLACVTPLAVGAVTVAVAVVVWRRRGRWAAAQILVVTAFAPALAEVLKALLPTWSHEQTGQLVWGGSFPSGHTAVTTALALGALSLVPMATVCRSRLLRYMVFALPVTVALSTVVVGWHEPADIIGGALLALAVHHGVSAVRMRRGH